MPSAWQPEFSRLRTQHNPAKRLRGTAIDPACRCRWDEQRRSVWPLGLTRCQQLYEVCRGSPIGRLPLRARINQPSAVDIGRCGKTPCASCRFPSPCSSWPLVRASQAANRRPNSEPARCAVGPILRGGAVCACAAVLLIAEGSPGQRDSSCAANVRSAGAENGLAVDEPHIRHPKAAGAVPQLGICALCLTTAILLDATIRLRISLRVCRLPFG